MTPADRQQLARGRGEGGGEGGGLKRVENRVLHRMKPLDCHMEHICSALSVRGAVMGERV